MLKNVVQYVNILTYQRVKYVNSLYINLFLTIGWAQLVNTHFLSLSNLLDILCLLCMLQLILHATAECCDSNSSTRTQWLLYQKSLLISSLIYYINAGAVRRWYEIYCNINTHTLSTVWDLPNPQSIASFFVYVL